MRTLLIALSVLCCCNCFSQQSSCGTGFASIDFTNALYGVDSVKDANNTKIAVPYTKPYSIINPDLADAEYQTVSYTNPNFTDEACHPLPTYCDNDAGNLVYYVYYPSNFDYVHCKAPAMILLHGGGFTDCIGSINTTTIQFTCREFAKRGYVCYDVEYRRGLYADLTETIILHSKAWRYIVPCRMQEAPSEASYRWKAGIMLISLRYLIPLV